MSHTWSNNDFIRENRLVYDVGGGTELPRSVETKPNESPENPENTKREDLHKKHEQSAKSAQEHEDETYKERQEALPKIEKEMEDCVTPEGEQKEKGETVHETTKEQTEEAETYLQESRETLSDPYQKDLFDVAMRSLSAVNKVAIYRDHVVWYDSCNTVTDFYKKIPPTVDKRWKQEGFASYIVFGSVEKMDIKWSPRLRELRDNVHAEFQLRVSESDRKLADNALQIMTQAQKQYLGEHPDVALILKRQQDEKVQKFNVISGNDNLWKENGRIGKFFKSNKEMNAETSSELKTILDLANRNKKGFKFELGKVSKEEQEKGENLSATIEAKDQPQLQKVQTLCRKKNIQFVVKKKEYTNTKDIVQMTCSATKLKQIIAELAMRNM